MMPIVQEKKTTNANIVIAHYFTATIVFFFITVLMFISSKSFIGHYFQPKLLAITHLTTLGWITLVIFGALYQLIPVIINEDLFSKKLAIFTFICLLIGTLLLAYSFWFFKLGFIIQLAATLLIVCATTFAVNLHFTIQKSNKNTIETDFILIAVYWFWFTVFIGALLSFNLSYSFLPKDHLHYLKIHAHVGMLGWFLMLIIGVSAKLIPMFLLSEKLDQKKLNYAFYFLNIALIGFLIDSIFFNGFKYVMIYLLLIAIGITYYCSFVKQAYKNRVRKKLDVGLKHSFLAILFILIPITLTTVSNSNLIADPKLQTQIAIAFGFSVLFGFISLLILGQTFKTLPFIVWLTKYQLLSGKNKTPLPKDLYSEKLAEMQLILFTIGYLLVILGILLTQITIIQIGCTALIITAIIYNINVFKIVFHKTKFLIKN